MATQTGSWLESVAAGFPGLAFLVSRDEEILACRVGSATLTVDPDEYVGHHLVDVTHPAGLAAARAAVERTLATGEPTTVDNDLLDERDRVISHRRHHYARAAPDQVAVLSRDVTDERTRIDADRLVSELAQLMLTAEPLTPERVVCEALRRVGTFLGARGIHVFVPAAHPIPGVEEFERPYGWNDGGPVATIPMLRHPTPSWVLETVSAADGPLLVAAKDVPDTATVMRWVIDQYGVAMFGYLPIALGESVPGFVCVTWDEPTSNVQSHRFEALGPLAGLMATMLLRQRAEQIRVDADARLRSLTEQSHEVVVLLDELGQPTFLSPSAGVASGTIVAPGRDASSLLTEIHPDDRNIIVGAFRTAQRSPGEPVEFAVRSTQGEDEHRAVGTITNLLGVAGVDSYVVNVRDVTAQYHARAELELAASSDRLTGLPNRDSLGAFLQDAFEDGQDLTVLFLDLDHFKRVNDGYGHTVGDQVLIQLSRRMRDAVGNRGIVARFAGDEFVVGCRGARGAVTLAQMVRSAIAEPLIIDGRSLRITASVGVAVSDGTADGDGDRVTPESLIRDADTALYEAKRRGRDTHVVVDDELRQRAVDRVELETALVRAVDGKELVVHFQPVVDLGTEARVGVEALVRWLRPGYGLVEPDAFVPVAEEIGMITHIDAWVLREALAVASPWHRDHGITISVNLSARDLLRDDLCSSVVDALRCAGLPGDALCLEITETGYSHAPDDAIRALQQLRAEGVHLAIDDFGSGYSSIDRVRRFPVDSLKMDRSLVDPILESDRDLAACRAVTELAHSLGLQLTAEGITTRAHHDALLALGCDFGQGFLYGAPVPPAELRWS